MRLEYYDVILLLMIQYSIKESVQLYKATMTLVCSGLGEALLGRTFFQYLETLWNITKFLTNLQTSL